MQLVPEGVLVQQQAMRAACLQGSERIMHENVLSKETAVAKSSHLLEQSHAASILCFEGCIAVHALSGVDDNSRTAPH